MEKFAADSFDFMLRHFGPWESIGIMVAVVVVGLVVIAAAIQMVGRVLREAKRGIIVGFVGLVILAFVGIPIWGGIQNLTKPDRPLYDKNGEPTAINSANREVQSRRK